MDRPRGRKTSYVSCARRLHIDSFVVLQCKLVLGDCLH